jgi:hypothetical protein
VFRNQTVSLGIENNRGRLFRRPKLTLSCSAEVREARVKKPGLLIQNAQIIVIG